MYGWGKYALSQIFYITHPVADYLLQGFSFMNWADWVMDINMGNQLFPEEVSRFLGVLESVKKE